MKTNYLKKTAFAAAAFAAAGTSFAAQAGDGQSLQTWAKEAGVSVDGAMKYPSIAARKGEQGVTTYRVTIDREGNLLASDRLESARSASINAASARAVRRVNFPALPEGYDDEKLTFSLRLTYAIAGSAFEKRALERDGRVTSRELANSGDRLTASISFLQDQAD
jgi:TonB family protein